MPPLTKTGGSSIESPETLAVTVAIPVKNEISNITRCIERLSRFDEIVLIDSDSTDGTIQVAQNFGVAVVQFQWNGQFPKKRNWFLKNFTPRNRWILFLDADEYLNNQFCDELNEALHRDDINGYWLSYTNYFFDTKLNYGLEQKKLALFRVGKAYYERIDDNRWSSLDMEIHEHPIVNGQVGRIAARIDHRDYKGLAHFLSKHTEYANWEAQRYKKLHERPENWEQLTKRQRFKYRHLAKWWYAAFYFLFTYILKQGFMDGRAGFQYAFYKSWYFNTIRLLIIEMGCEHSN